MSTTRWRQAAQTIKELPQRIIGFVSGAVTRIFAPSDDDYPATGVQPFEGDPADDRHH
jgi:hypothetical protein